VFRQHFSVLYFQEKRRRQCRGSFTHIRPACRLWWNGKMLRPDECTMFVRDGQFFSLFCGRPTAFGGKNDRFLYFAEELTCRHFILWTFFVPLRVKKTEDVNKGKIRSLRFTGIRNVYQHITAGRSASPRCLCTCTSGLPLPADVLFFFHLSGPVRGFRSFERMVININNNV